MHDVLALLAHGKLGMIWRLFLDDPRREWSQKEVIRETRISTATAVSTLRTLVREGMITMTIKGTANYYALADTPTNRQLKISMMVHALRPLSTIGDTFLFGSCARGEDTPDSDIDILAIGTPRKDILVVTEPLSRKMGRRIMPLSFSPSEWAAMRKKDPAFFERVEMDKIRL